MIDSIICWVGVITLVVAAVGLIYYILRSIIYASILKDFPQLEALKRYNIDLTRIGSTFEDVRKIKNLLKTINDYSIFDYHSYKSTVINQIQDRLVELEKKGKKNGRNKKRSR